MPSPSGQALLQLDTDLDGLLFEEEADAFAVMVYSNERPACGLAGRLDWRLGGAVSRAIRQGGVTGKAGDLTYLPFARKGRVLHFLLLGLGDSPEPGKRAAPQPAQWERLKRAAQGLGLERLGISRADVGSLKATEIAQQLDGLPLWVIP